MRREQPDLYTRAFALLVAALACAGYIAWHVTQGETASLAWVPLLLCTLGALHYFRRARG